MAFRKNNQQEHGFETPQVPHMDALSPDFTNLLIKRKSIIPDSSSSNRIDKHKLTRRQSEALLQQQLNNSHLMPPDRFNQKMQNPMALNSPMSMNSPCLSLGHSGSKISSNPSKNHKQPQRNLSIKKSQLRKVTSLQKMKVADPSNESKSPSPHHTFGSGTFQKIHVKRARFDQMTNESRDVSVVEEAMKSIGQNNLNIMGIFDEIHQVSNVCQMSSQQISKLQAQIGSQRMFLNMVVHDLRAPTTSIKASLNFVIKKLKEIKTMHDDQKTFTNKCSVLDSRLRQTLMKSEERKKKHSQIFGDENPFVKKLRSQSNNSSAFNTNAFVTNMEEKMKEKEEEIQVKKRLSDIIGAMEEFQNSENSDKLEEEKDSRSRSPQSSKGNMSANLKNYKRRISIKPVLALIRSESESIDASNLCDDGNKLQQPQLNILKVFPTELEQKLHDYPDEEPVIDNTNESLTSVSLPKVNWSETKQSRLMLATKDKILKEIKGTLQKYGIIQRDEDEQQGLTHEDQRKWLALEGYLTALILNEQAHMDVSTQTDTELTVPRLSASPYPIITGSSIRARGSLSNGQLANHQRRSMSGSHSVHLNSRHSSSMLAPSIQKQNTLQWKEITEKLKSRDEEMKKMLQYYSNELKVVQDYIHDLENQNYFCLKKMKAQDGFFREILDNIFEQTIESEKLLQKQIFSLQMSENLINDLLDLAKLDNSKFSLTKEYFDLPSTIYQTFEMLLTTANESEIELRAEIDKKLNLNFFQCVLGDQRRYIQILLNFLTNALKFTNKKGVITVSLKVLSSQKVLSLSSHSPVSPNAQSPSHQYGSLRKPQSKISLKSSDIDSNEEDSQLGDNEVMKFEEDEERFLSFEIKISDTGTGISKDGLANLFVDFGKLTENSKRNKSGTGLGLSICKKIIEQMSGSVSVSSELHKGTTFTVKLKTKCKLKHTEFNEISAESNSVSMSFNESNNFKVSSPISSMEQPMAQSSAQKKRVHGFKLSPAKNGSSPSLSIFQSNTQDLPFQFINKPASEKELNTCIKDQIEKNIKNQFQQQEEGKQVKNKLYSRRKTIFYNKEIDKLLEKSGESAGGQLHPGVKKHQSERGLKFQKSKSLRNLNQGPVQGSNGGSQRQLVCQQDNPLMPKPMEFQGSLGMIEENEINQSESVASSSLSSKVDKGIIRHQLSQNPRRVYCQFSNPLEVSISNSKSNKLTSKDEILSQQQKSHSTSRQSRSRSNSFSAGQLTKSIKEMQLIQAQIAVGINKQVVIEEDEDLVSRPHSESHRKFSRTFGEESEEFIEDDEEEDAKIFRCLLANDEPLQLMIWKMLFEQIGMEVVQSQNGYHAFQQVEQTLKTKKDFFDLVLLDLHMPVSDGYEACTDILALFEESPFFNASDKDESVNNSRLQESSFLEPPISSNQQSNPVVRNTTTNNSNFNFFQKQDYKPLMVACSSLINEEILVKTKKAGFDRAFINPLSSKQIEDDLLPMLHQRLLRIQEKQRFSYTNPNRLIEQIGNRLEMLSVNENSSQQAPQSGFFRKPYAQDVTSPSLYRNSSALRKSSSKSFSSSSHRLLRSRSSHQVLVGNLSCGQKMGQIESHKQPLIKKTSGHSESPSEVSEEDTDRGDESPDIAAKSILVKPPNPPTLGHPSPQLSREMESNHNALESLAGKVRGPLMSRDSSSKRKPNEGRSSGTASFLEVGVGTVTSSPIIEPMGGIRGIVDRPGNDVQQQPSRMIWEAPIDQIIPRSAQSSSKRPMEKPQFN